MFMLSSIFELLFNSVNHPKFLIIGWIGEKIGDLFKGMFNAGSKLCLELLVKALNGIGYWTFDAVGLSPTDINSTLVQKAETIHNSVILPIVGVILTFILGINLINKIVNKNNLRDVDQHEIAQWIIHAVISVFLCKNAFKIVMALIDVGQYLTKKVLSIAMNGSTTLVDVNAFLSNADSLLEELSVGAALLFFLLCIFMIITSFSMLAVIVLTIYARFLEIIIYVSLAGIPIATVFGGAMNMGVSYFKKVVALALQGCIMVIILASYSTISNGILQSIAGSTGNESMSGFTGLFIGTAATLLLLSATLKKSGSIASAIVGA